MSATPLAFGPFVLDPAEARLSREGQPLALNGRPLQVLALLASRAGQLVEKDAVLDAVWGHRHVTESVLKGAVNTLRTALGDDAQQPRFVETVPRRGYRFIATVRPAAAAPATPAAAGNLPPPGLPLVGREADAARLGALLRQHRLVTLTGLGGVGKTRLALACAGTEAPPDGCWLLRLDALDAPELVVPALAQALGLGGGAGGSAAALARALAAQRLRLVLDNAEHLVDAVAALVLELLQQAGGVQILVTSQVPLRLAGEQRMALAPLALPQGLADAAPDPADYAAAQLFCERVRQQQPGYAPTAQEHADIAAICRALDGVPLALELAAARVPLLGVAGVRARLDQRFALLTRGPRDAAQRHRTLAAALDWTVGLLSADEQAALQQLALFSGSFGTEAAEAVLGRDDALDLVDALRERSLVVAEPGARLRLFDSVRRHAQERAADAAAQTAARERHLAWVLRHFEQAHAVLASTPQLEWLPPLRAEVDNLRSALHFGLDAGAPPPRRDTGLRLLAASGPFWFRSGLRTEGLRWFDAARTAPATAAFTQARLDLEYAQFVAHAQLGSPHEALAAVRRARPELLAAGATLDAFMSLVVERNLLYRTAPGPQDATLIAQARALLQPAWGTLVQRSLRMLEALHLRDHGDFEGYLRQCEANAADLRAAGGRAEAWPHENGLGQALLLMGRGDEAAAVLRRMADDIRSAGMQREHVQSLAMAASVGLLQRADAATLALAREAVRLLRADGMLWWMADALPWAAWHAGRHDDATRLLAWADARVQARGEQRGRIFGLLHERMAAALAGQAPAGAALDDDSAVALALGADDGR